MAARDLDLPTRLASLTSLRSPIFSELHLLAHTAYTTIYMRDEKIISILLSLRGGLLRLLIRKPLGLPSRNDLVQSFFKVGKPWRLSEFFAEKAVRCSSGGREELDRLLAGHESRQPNWNPPGPLSPQPFSKLGEELSHGHRLVVHDMPKPVPISFRRGQVLHASLP